MIEAEIAKHIVDWASLGVSTGVFCLLAYLLIVIGPRMIRELAQRDKERDKASREERKDDRETRHNTVEVFQRCIMEMHVEHAEESKIDRLQHEKDAKADRDAFERRNERLEDALKVQTAELKAAIAAGGCRFFPQLPALPPQTADNTPQKPKEQK